VVFICQNPISLLVPNAAGHLRQKNQKISKKHEPLTNHFLSETPRLLASGALAWLGGLPPVLSPHRAFSDEQEG